MKTKADTVDPIDRLTEKMNAAIRALAAWPGRAVRLFHHNDTDGLCSGAILTRALMRAGFDVQRVCLEKPYPPVLEKIFAAEGNIFVFADFAGRIAPLISALNRGRNLTLILDHHVARPATDPAVHNLDGELFGLKGDRDITASTTCFVFAQALDPVNADLAHLAVTGAVGDGFFVEGCLAGENRKVARLAARQGTIAIQPAGDRETYVYRSLQKPIPCDEMSAYLNTLGAAGYYQAGPEMGIRVCLEGFSAASDRLMDACGRIQTEAFAAETHRLREGGLRLTPHVQWFHVDDRFSPMGVKTIGKFCESIRQQDFVDPGRYLAGFQRIPDRIPGFGDISMQQVKISMRVSPVLEEKIRSGSALGLDTLLPEATKNVGGFADACHRLAAATTVAAGKETALIAAMEKILQADLNRTK